MQFYLRSVHVDVRPCVVVATQAKSGNNRNDLELYKYNIEEKKNGQLSKGETFDVSEMLLGERLS